MRDIASLIFATYILLLPQRLLAQQIVFSVDVQGPTAGFFGTEPGPLDRFYGQEISGGDLLTVGAPDQPLPPSPALAVRGPVEATPGIFVFGQNTPLANTRSLNLAPVLIGGRPEPEVEVDAISFGRDDGRAIYFSVDEFSGGLPGTDVFDQALRAEASADIFRTMFGQDGNELVVDGLGGEFPNNALGLGLFEPNSPNPVIDEGDNLDALDVNGQPSDFDGPIYFSLDGSFPDPLEPEFPTGPNIGSAQQNGVSPADILVSRPRQPTQVFIPAEALGLNPSTDDLDALAFLDVQQNGRFDEEDSLLFSVRRGSQIIGQVDAALGRPIGPGDILRPPLEPGAPPEIFIPAEILGLFTGQQEANFQLVSDPHPDDLDALSLGRQDGDMNCNFIWDLDDVVAFASALESVLLYDDRYPFCGTPTVHGDLSLDGRFDFQDKERFIRVMTNAGTLRPEEIRAAFSSVPEPKSTTSMVLAGMLLLLNRSRNDGNGKNV